MLLVVGRGCGYVNNTAGDTAQVRFAAQAAMGNMSGTQSKRDYNSIQ
jgi:hypothetical protein